MNHVPLKRQSIIPRIDGITRDITRLRELASIPLDEFSDDKNPHIDVAKARLREALEGVFNIGAHILARIEGARASEYKEIARKLGDYHIVEKKFVDAALIRMAGYRNRLTHFYAEIKPQELHRILNENLGDFEVFLSAVKRVLEHPEQFGLILE